MVAFAMIILVTTVLSATAANNPYFISSGQPDNETGTTTTTGNATIAKKLEELLMTITGHDDACDIDRELLALALHYARFERRLLLTDSRGISEEGGINAVDYIREFLVDKLSLPFLHDAILNARVIDEGILFELNTARAALEVLANARVKLQGSCFAIAESERSLVELAIFARISSLIK